jgi:hypothetical protein
MTRALSGTDAAEVASAILGVVEFLAIALPTGTLYLTSGDRAYIFGGQTYQPSNGQWGTVGNYNETADSTPRPMQIQLSGVDATLISHLVGNSVQWVQITYSLGFTDKHGTLLDNPSFTAPMFLGDCTIALTDKGGTIAIAAENLLADLQNRNSGQLQTDADQQKRFPGDTFFQDIASVINKLIYWGQYGPNQLGVTSFASPSTSGRGQATFDRPQ